MTSVALEVQKAEVLTETEVWEDFLGAHLSPNSPNPRLEEKRRGKHGHACGTQSRASSRVKLWRGVREQDPTFSFGYCGCLITLVAWLSWLKYQLYFLMAA